MLVICKNVYTSTCKFLNYDRSKTNLPNILNIIAKNRILKNLPLRKPWGRIFMQK